MGANRELLTVRMTAIEDMSQVYSGVARMAGVLWCTRVRATQGRRARTALVVAHPFSNFMGHYALDPWASYGVDAVGMTTRYIGNDSALLIENCVLDVADVVRSLREEGYQRVVLVGNSGGGGLAALYQSQATKPTITSSPGGAGPDLTAAHLPPVDGLVMLMAHPGRATLLTELLDPSLVSEEEPFNRDQALDLFAPGRELPLDRNWLADYRAAQLARNESITDNVLARLSTMRERGSRVGDDLPMVVHGVCADPRMVDVTIDPSDRAPGTFWGPPERANYMPTTLGHYTSLQSWLSQWSVRTSNGDAAAQLQHVNVPVHVVSATADQLCFPTHAKALFESVPHDRKQLTEIVGGLHYLTDQPALVDQMARTVAEWADTAA